jgi:hypothetical protein
MTTRDDVDERGDIAERDAVTRELERNYWYEVADEVPLPDPSHSSQVL